MGLMENKRAVVKFSFLTLVFVIAGGVVLFASGVLALTHTSDADLNPEWSAAGQDINYGVEISNTGGNTIDEVRVYKNDNYENFVCQEKSGWELNFINVLQACFYVQDPNDIPEGDSEVFYFNAKTNTNPEETCELEWQFETRDENNYWQFIYDTTSIDSDSPEIVKEVTGPQNLDGTGEPCPSGPKKGEECWITDQTEISVFINDTSGEQCNSGLNYCKISYRLDGGAEQIIAEESSFEEGQTTWSNSFTFEEDSVHELTIYCEDVAGNEVKDVEIFRVDSTKPETTKTYGEPSWPLGINAGGLYPHFISLETSITLNAVDPDPTGESCNIGVEWIKYRDFIVPDEFCEQEELCTSDEIGDGKYDEGVNWTTVEDDIVTFYKDEESCHVIQFYGADSLGNFEDFQTQCVFIDGTPPILRKVHSEGMIEDDDVVSFPETDGVFHWMTDEMPIDLYCEDTGEHPVNEVTIYYREWNDIEGYGDWIGVQDDHTQVYFDEDSVHKLEYYCEDILGNSNGTEETPYIQYYRVDSTPPKINKEMIGDNHLGECPPQNETDECYIANNEGNGVLISVSDPDPTGNQCNVGNVLCNYEVRWYSAGYPGEYETVDSGEFQGSQEIIFTEDSTHDLYVICGDDLGNTYEDTETFFVDSEVPKTKKWFGEPFIGEIGSTEWISSETPIYLNATDEKVGVDKTYWRNLLIREGQEGWDVCANPERYCNEEYYSNYVENPDEQFQEYADPIYKNEESCHVLEYYSIDKFGNEELTNSNCFFIDNTAPETWKEIGEPMKGNQVIFSTTGDGESEYDEGMAYLYAGLIENYPPSNEGRLRIPLDGFTLNDLNSLSWDSEVMGGYLPHVDVILENGKSLTFEYAKVDPSECDNAHYPTGELNTFDDKGIVDGNAYAWENIPGPCGDASFDAQHKSLDDWKAVYGGVNVEALEIEVDGWIAESESYINNIMVNGENILFFAYVTSETPVTLTCEDQEPHPVEETAFSYRYRYSDDCETWNEWTNWSEVGNDSIYFQEDSCHELEYYCVDGLGNQGPIEREIDVVDTQPPVIGKQIIGPYTQCNFVEEPNEKIELLNNAYAVGDLVHELNVTDLPVPGWPNHCSIGIAFDGNSLYYDICSDSNIYEIDPITGNLRNTFDTGINYPNALAYDAKRNGIWFGSQSCDVDGMPIYFWDFSDDSVNLMFHVPYGELLNICFTDGLAYNENDPNTDADDEIWFSDDVDDIIGLFRPDGTLVDTYDPTTIDSSLSSTSGLAIGGPNLYLGNNGGGDVFRADIDSWTFLDEFASTSDRVEDMECDPVTFAPTEVMWVRHTPQSNSNDDIITAHVIEPGTCGLGGEEPEPQEECYIIDGITNISIDAIDPEPHPVGEEWCEWRYYWDIEETWTEWMTAEELPFLISGWDESQHDLEVRCYDGLGNYVEDFETFYVDKTPPEVWKEYEGHYYNETINESLVEWINTGTEILMSAYDPQPHPSGLDSLEYRISLVDDEACWSYDVCETEEGSGEWTDYNGSVNINEQSCHLIEIVASDKVEKTSLHKQCVFVDDTAPETFKTVGEPSEPWDGLGANFYDLDDFCSIEGNCWKVTTMTPITLDCNDPEPHPVNHEEIYFNVELDGDDYTEIYCDNIENGIYNESGNGYCYVSGKNAPVNFFFTEESEHNLKYYCVDALGNKGYVDDEKFKVEGDAFRIKLNKKWNLISVPVKLLDDQMDVVFEDIADDVEALWQFDGETWHVYTPDGNSGNDDITTMEPGWGYWILAQNDSELVIGGSLISPAMTPPSRDIVQGWNLIGYYGTEGLENYTWPEGNGKQARCALYSLGKSEFDKGWSSLIGYWETYNPNQWSYEWNNVPEQGSEKYGYFDKLDPGAGYWLLAQDEGIYAPSTNCNPII